MCSPLFAPPDCLPDHGSQRSNHTQPPGFQRDSNLCSHCSKFFTSNFALVFSCMFHSWVHSFSLRSSHHGPCLPQSISLSVKSIAQGACLYLVQKSFPRDSVGRTADMQEILTASAEPSCPPNPITQSRAYLYQDRTRLLVLFDGGLPCIPGLAGGMMAS